jgi:hypothetical protein
MSINAFILSLLQLCMLLHTASAAHFTLVQALLHSISVSAFFINKVI